MLEKCYLNFKRYATKENSCNIAAFNEIAIAIISHCFLVVACGNRNSICFGSANQRLCSTYVYGGW